MHINEVSKAGLPHELINPEIDPYTRVIRALPYLHKISNTTSGVLLRWIFEDLYDFKDALKMNNVETLFKRVQERSYAPSWQNTLYYDTLNLKGSITVEEGTPHSDNIHFGNEKLKNINLIDGKHSSLELLKSMEETLGRAILRAKDFVDYTYLLLDTIPIDKLKLIAFWVVPSINDLMITDHQINEILSKTRKGESLSADEVGSFSYYGFIHVLEKLIETKKIPVQIFTGADVFKPHLALPQWNYRFCSSIARIASEFNSLHFNLVTASDAFTQDIAILAKHFPNISVSGYWWHMLYPYYIRKSLETRLDCIPADKIVGFFSDAYHLEWVYPKLKLVKQILGSILEERVESGWYTLKTAAHVIHTLFHDAPKRIFDLE
ncbi:MAG: hypothetical protein K9L21_05375 [Spirochaetia bacterium]|nr:hypothetical protein [Spirochaetia bacterium]